MNAARSASAPRLAASTGRLAVLSLLAVAFLIFHGLSIHQQLMLGSSIATREGFAYSLDEPRAIVADVVRELPGGPSPAYVAGLQPGDDVLLIQNAHGGQFRIRGLFDHGDALRSIRFGEPWWIVVERALPAPPAPPDGAAGRVPDAADAADSVPKPLAARLSVPPLPRPRLDPFDLLLVIGLFVVMPLLALVAAVLVGFGRPDDNHAFIASLLFFAFPTLFFIRADAMPEFVRHIVLAGRSCGPIFTGYLTLCFFLTFPVRSPLDIQFPWLKRFFFWVAALYALYRLVFAFSRHISFAAFHRLHAPLVRVGAADVLDGLTSPLLLLMCGLGIAALVQNAQTAQTKADRRRLQLLLASTLIGLVPLAALLMLSSGFGQQPVWLLLLVAVTLWVFPAGFVYAVVRHQVFGIKLILRRGLQYTLVTRGVVTLGFVLFALLYFTAGQALERLLPQGGPWLGSLIAAAVALLIAGGLRETNRRVLPAIDRAFFREAYDARRILSELADAVRQLAVDPDRLLELVAAELHNALHPNGVVIFLRADEATWMLSPDRSSASTAAELLASGRSEFCCALVAPSSADGRQAAPAQLMAGSALPASSQLAALVERQASRTSPRAIDVVPAGPDWDARPAPPDAIRLSQLTGGDRAILEPLAARLLVPLATRRRTIGFIVLGDKLSEEPYTREDRELLLSVASQTAIALDYAQLIDQAAERERVRQDLELAQQVQAQLFPQVRPALSTLDYVGVSQPARILGGDYFDFIPVAEGRLGVALADLSGKGIAAALLMATLQGALRGHAFQYGERIAELVAEVNQQLCVSSAPNRFATFFYGLYDDATRTLRYVNAGHNPPLLVRAPIPAAVGAAPADLPEARGNRPGVPGSVHTLTRGGTVIGLFPDRTYDDEVVQLGPGDTLVIFSDGVIDVTNPADQPFGDERLADLVARNAHLSPAALRDLVLSELEQHASGVPFEDDVTLILARVR